MELEHGRAWMREGDVCRLILDAKRTLGKDLVILWASLPKRDEVIRFADHRGDSLEL